MARRYKPVTHTSTIDGAVADALSELQGLRDEVREIVENASGTGLENTQRIQTLSETADTLDSHVDDEPDAPDAITAEPQKQITYVEMTKKRGVSRAQRHDNAIAQLSAAVAGVEEMIEALEAEEEKAAEEQKEQIEEKKSDLETYRDAIQELIDNLDGAVEYPGMFG